MVTEYQYDALNRLIAKRYPANPALNVQYHYDMTANGNHGIGRLTAVQDASGVLGYTYDLLDRLTEETSASDKKTCGYDATGNREHRTSYSLANGSETQQAKQSLTYESTSNRLSKRSNAFAVEVDAAGHYTRYSYGRRYTYDEQGRLSQALTADGALLASYRYNALGQRTTKQAHKNGLVYPFTYLYGPDGQLLGEVEYLSSGRKKRAQYFVWLDGLPLAAIEMSYASDGSIANSTTTCLHADHLNTPRLATNQAGQLVWSWQSDAFGVGSANIGVDGDGVQTDIPLRFPGQIADIHSSLNYNYFRDYDPETGRYVESDPIGLDGGLNTYGYVSANPMITSDALGLRGNVTVVVAPPARSATSNGEMLPYNGGALSTCNTILCIRNVNDEFPPIGPEVPPPQTFSCPIPPQEPDCSPPAGTICSEFHTGGTPHKVTDFEGNKLPPQDSHVHTWQMNKTPLGQCIWNKRRQQKHTFNYTPVDAKACDSYPSWRAQQGI